MLQGLLLGQRASLVADVGDQIDDTKRVEEDGQAEEVDENALRAELAPTAEIRQGAE